MQVDCISDQSFLKLISDELLFILAIFSYFFFFPDFLFKFLVIGSAGAGKSCILHQFIENKCKIWIAV